MHISLEKKLVSKITSILEMSEQVLNQEKPAKKVKAIRAIKVFVICGLSFASCPF